jgi:predicted protein tyrosine phosphatase
MHQELHSLYQFANRRKNEFIICMSENRLRIQTIEEVFPHYENVSAIGCGMNKDVAAPVSVEILSSGQTSSL